MVQLVNLTVYFEPQIGGTIMFNNVDSGMINMEVFVKNIKKFNPPLLPIVFDIRISNIMEREGFSETDLEDEGLMALIQLEAMLGIDVNPEELGFDLDKFLKSCYDIVDKTSASEEEVIGLCAELNDVRFSAVF